MAAAAGVSETQRFARRAAAASARRPSALLETAARATGMTLSGIVLLVIGVMAWALGYLVAGRPLYLLAYGAWAVVALSWVIGRRPLPLTGERSEARPRIAEGETIGMTVSLTAKRRLSTFILEEEVPPLLGQQARVPVATLESGQTVEHSYDLTCWRRGVYQLGPLNARWGDPFGLTERSEKLAEPFELLVHPSIEPVQDRPLTRLWEDPPIRPPISKPWPFGMEFYGMRAYTPGDDLRRIVWRAFARTGQLLVRESEQGITDQMTIVLDQSRQFHSKGAVSESFEAGVKAAASLGVHHLREGYSVTLEGNNRRLVGPLRGPNSPMSLLDELARADLAKESLTGAIMRMVADARSNAHVIILTPHLDAEAAARLKLLLERGSHCVVGALMWDEGAADTLGRAAALGAQVVEIRPNMPLAVAFRNEIGAGR